MSKNYFELKSINLNVNLKNKLRNKAKLIIPLFNYSIIYHKFTNKFSLSVCPHLQYKI